MTDTLTRPAAEAESWTAREIRQQPDTLAATYAGIARDRAAIEAFVAPLLTDRATRIVLTGAGTSAFIGEALAPELSRRLNRCVEAIATTDLVSAPHLHFRREAPILLVSFGRSGSSPESVAAVDLADRLVESVHHLIVTCNPDGELAQRRGANAHVALLPDATHDRSFAMTSSFTAMTLTALAVLGGIDALAERLPSIVAATEQALAAEPHAAALAARGFERVVYLGSGVFKGLAREAALKLMELSDGAVVTAFDTPMGFRHGPKTIVTDRTLVVVFESTDPLTRRYDRDVIAELRGDGIAEVVVIGTGEGADLALDAGGLGDAELLFAFIVPAQLFALHVSLSRGLTPDRPNATGTVNRVVKGVRIHA